VRLRQMGLSVRFQRGAGLRAEFDDQQYAEAGATLADSSTEVHDFANVILKVAEPSLSETDMMKPGTTLIGFIWPAQNKTLVAKLAARGVTTFAMDCVPRISRAQSMDALSAMANLAGYRAVLAAANAYPRLMSGQVTAAGTVRPAKVLVIGGGVAGLAAIAAARRRVHRIDFSELLDIVQIWVDAALRLTSRDLKLMQRLVSRQNGLGESQQVH
jgi:NAD/NADP transhydrogenase alpha subunit